MAEKCLNRNLPEIISLATAINSSPSLTAAMISVWQNDTGVTDDVIPTLNQFRKHHFDSINSELRGSIKIVTEYDQKSAEARFKHSKDILGSTFVSTPSQGKDIRGRTVYRYTVKTPEDFQELKNTKGKLGIITSEEIPRIKPEYNSMFNTVSSKKKKEIPEYFFSTKEYTVDLLKKLHENPEVSINGERNVISVLKLILSQSRNPVHRVLAAEYIKTAEKFPIRYDDVTIKDEGVTGTFIGWNRKIVIDAAKILENFKEDSDLWLETNILHEMTHAMSIHAYRANPEFKQKINSFFNTLQLRGIFSGNNYYGLTKPEEFIAEAMSNPEFQSFLASFRYDTTGSKTESIWDAFVKLLFETFKSVYGVDVKDTVLSETIKIIAENFPHYSSDYATFYEGFNDIISFDSDKYLAQNQNQNQIYNKKIDEYGYSKTMMDFVLDNDIGLPKNYEEERYIASKNKEVEPRDVEQESKPDFKPKGLWYSLGLAWPEWVRGEMPEWGNSYNYLHHLNITDKVLKINNVKEALAFTAKYGEKSSYMNNILINWNKVAKDHSGIEIKDAYRLGRTNDPKLWWIYPWDIAGGVVWKKDGVKDTSLVYQHSKKSEEESSLFSLDKDDTKNEDVERILHSVLSMLGVNYESVQQILDAKGNIVPTATGVSGITKSLTGNLLKFIKLVQGEAGTGVLAEETVHMVIEMLPKEGALFQGMYKQIDKFKEYEEVRNNPNYQKQYGDNDYKMRKEAMGKLVSKIIIDKNYNPESVEVKKVLTFWEKVKEFFGKKLGLIKPQIKLFKDLAEKILAEDISELSDKNATEGLYYNMTDIQKDIVEAYKEKAKRMTRVYPVNKKEKAYYNITKPDGTIKKIPYTVTQKRDKKFKKVYPEPDKYTQDRTDMLQQFGLDAHSDMENVISRLNDPGAAKIIKTSPQAYDVLEKYLLDITNPKSGYFPEGTIFLSEVKVADKKDETGTTIDFIAVEPDGTESIIDWKMMVFTKAEKETYKVMRNYKQEPYQYQVTETRRISSEYSLKTKGVKKKYKYLRLVPFEIELREDPINRSFTPVIESLKAGSMSGTGSDTKLAYLNPLPTVSEPGTKPKEFDEYVKKLIAIHDKFDRKTPTTREGKINKVKTSSELMGAIREIQVNSNLQMFVKFATAQLTDILDTLESGTAEEIKNNIVSYKELVDVVSFIKQNFEEVYSEKSALYGEKFPEVQVFKESQKAFDTLATSKLITDINTQIRLKTKELLTSVSDQAHIKDFTKAAPEMNSLIRWFGGLNLFNHPMFKILWNLISNSKEKVRIQKSKLFDDIKKKTEGLTLSDYKKIINPTSGNLIQPYDKSYYERLENLAAAGDGAEIRKLVTINEVGLNAYLKEERDYYEKRYAKYKNKSFLNKKLKELAETTDVINSNTALVKIMSKGQSNFLSKWVKKIPPTEALKQKYSSAEYRTLQSDKKLFEFYEFFKEKIDEFKEFLPVDITGNFVPNIEADLLERTLRDLSGTTGKEDLMDIINNNFAPETNYFMGEIDENGDYKKSIPLYFINSVKNKSIDLGSVLYLFGSVAYNYKNMSAIEDSVSLLRDALVKSKEAAVDGSGETPESETRGGIVEKNLDLTTLMEFDEFVGHYLHGKRFVKNLGHFKKTVTRKNKETGEDEQVELAYDKTRLLTNVQSWWGKVVLAGSPIAGAAALFGAGFNGLFLSFKHAFFTEAEYLESLAEVSAGPFNSLGLKTKAYSITEAFDLGDINNDMKKAGQLSAVKANHYSANDTMMFMFRAADHGVSNAILLSILKSHTIIKNGLPKPIKNLSEDEQKNAKSIYSQLEEKDGVLNIHDVLNEKEFSFIRNKAYRLTETVVGVSPRENMNRMRLHIEGNAFMQFKNWMPMMVHERFAGVDYDAELDSITKGKYIVFWKTIANKHFLPMIAETLKTVIGAKNSEEFDALLYELYEKELDKNKTLDDSVFTFAAYKQMYIENLRSTVMELGTVAAGLALLSLMRGGDDPKNKQEKFMIKAWDRIMSEFTFFLSPDALGKFVKGSIPLIGFLGNLYDFTTHFSKEVFGTIIDNDEIKKEAKPMKYVYRTFPIANTIDRNWEFFFEDPEK